MSEIICSFCKATFDDSLKRCPQCNTKAPKQAQADSDIVFVPLTIVNGVPERDIFLSILEDEGIAAYSDVANDQTPDAIFGETDFGAPMQIFVEEAQADKAKELYAEFEAAPAEFDEDSEYWRVPGDENGEYEEE